MALHHSTEYSLDGGAWVMAVADEEVGPGKSYEITGLDPGSYSARLRITPLTGGGPAVISTPFTLVVEDFSDVGHQNQSAQIQAISAGLEFIASVSQSQAINSNALAATLQFTAAGTQAQPAQVQSASSSGIMEITGTSEQTQLVQVRSGSGALVFYATVTTTQAVQSSAASGTHTAASVPDQVTLGTVTNSPAQITVPWTDLGNETSYELFYADTTASVAGTLLTATGYGVGDTAYPGTPNATAGKITGIAANQVSYTLTGMLTQGVTYYVKVAGRNASGLGALSAAGSAAAAAAPGPTEVTIYASSANDVSIVAAAAGDAWATVRGATDGVAVIPGAGGGALTTRLEQNIDGGEGAETFIHRIFLSFNLQANGVVAGSTINSAIWNGTTYAGGYTSGVALAVREGSQATTPITADFNNFGTVEFGNTGAITSAGTKPVTLDANGKAYIATMAGGTAKLCIMNYANDSQNVAPGSGAARSCEIRSADYIDPAVRPNIVVNYTPP